MGHIVLLVDDDNNVLHGLARALHKQPYQLYTARSGEEAMFVLKAHAVDVIVADEQMPGMSGSDLLIWVAQTYPEIVRIILTGRATAETAIRAINEGAVYHFFNKPCNEVQLAVIIRKALEHKDLVDENRRLLQSHQQQVRQEQQFREGLTTLLHLVSTELGGSLRSLTQSCAVLQRPREDRSADQHPDGFDSHSAQLLDQALDAVEKVQHGIDELLEKKDPPP